MERNQDFIEVSRLCGSERRRGERTLRRKRTSLFRYARTLRLAEQTSQWVASDVAFARSAFAGEPSSTSFPGGREEHH